MMHSTIPSHYIRREHAKEPVGRNPKTIYRYIKRAIETNDADIEATNNDDEYTMRLKARLKVLKALLSHCSLELKRDGKVIDGTNVQSMKQIDQFRREGRIPMWHIDPAQFRNFFESETSNTSNESKPPHDAEKSKAESGQAATPTKDAEHDKIEKLYKEQIAQMKIHADLLTKELKIAHTNLSAEKKVNHRREKKDDKNRNELLGIIAGLQKLSLSGVQVDPSTFNKPPASDDQRTEKPKQSQKPSVVLDVETPSDDQQSESDDSKRTQDNDAIPEKGNHANLDNDNAPDTNPSDTSATPTKQTKPQPKTQAEVNVDPAATPKKPFSLSLPRIT